MKMNQKGFTLLEVLVALVILGTAVVAAIQGFAGGLRLLKLSGDHQEAMLLADQKVREMTTPVEGREEGTEDRFQWSRTVTRVPMPELEGSVRGRRWGSFEVDVRVRWDDKREVQLASLRTVPVDASGKPIQPDAPGRSTSQSQTTTPGTITTPTTQTTPTTPTTPGRLSPRTPTK
jgi:prepilin-type N-terminal cleavage/methylation domain-containing protein